VRHQSRVIMVLITFALVAAASIGVAKGAQGSNPRSRAIWPTWGHARRVPAGQPEPEPAHWVHTLGPHISGPTETDESTNWSGYIETGPQFTGVSGRWIVPAVQPSQASEYSSGWIGIDGATNNSLIQTGTTQETSGGSTTYFAWYEILPAASIPIGTVSPGDEMEASIFQDSPGTWTIAIADVTSGQSTSGEVSYSGPGASAEWIEEAPTINGQQSTLANFGTADFSDLDAAGSNLSSGVLTPVDMVDGGGNVVAYPGAISNSSFTITYGSPPTPAPTTTAVSVNPTATAFGTAVDYSATVTSAGGTPTGTVTFTSGTTLLCTTGELLGGSGSCSAANAPAGTDTITATYSANAEFDGSMGTTSLSVSAPPSTPTPTQPPPPAHGYWLVGSDGGIFTFGSAQFFGSTGSLKLQRPVVGITPTADRGGYWLVASDGGIFSFGDAGFYGSLPGLGIAPAGTPGTTKKLNAPIVGMVPSADGDGYFMVASDGGVFAFGDAKFEGSCPGIGGCSGAAVAVMPDATGNGYWVVTATGHLYTFGDAPYFGAPGPQASPVTSAVRTPDGGGYWILLADGVVYEYGDASNFGDAAGAPTARNPATTIFADDNGSGFWIGTANGTVWAYGAAPDYGDMAGSKLNGSIIAATGW
jgi:hypothetical protein